MLQIKNLTLTHKKDLRIIIEKLNLVLNHGDKAVIIGEEGKHIVWSGQNGEGGTNMLSIEPEFSITVKNIEFKDKFDKKRGLIYE